MESAMPCKVQNLRRGEASGKNKPNTRGSKHASGKGFNSSSHYNLLHKFILMPQAMQIPDVKAAVVK